MLEDVINVYCVDIVNAINMEDNKKVTIGCSSPLTVVIFLAFFFAKIFNKIDWSWWWVFAPIWVPAILATIIFIIFIGLKLWALWR